jgi:hypothetical protein
VVIDGSPRLTTVFRVEPGFAYSRECLRNCEAVNCQRIVNACESQHVSCAS